MEIEHTLKWIAVIVALSGWMKVYLDHIGNRPKMAGRILCVLKGHIENNGKVYTNLLLYPYITNTRKNEVHILDYELFYKENWHSSWKPVPRAYGFEKINNFYSTSSEGEQINLSNLKEKLIYTKGGIVKHGMALHGWIPFMGPPDLHALDEYKHKLVCIDAFGRRHSIVQGRDKGVSIYLVMELADMSLPKHMIDNLRN